MMDINEIYAIATTIGAIGVTLGVLMYAMTRMRHDRYDLELKKMQLDVMRHSLELKSYEANEALMADPLRWQSVNHLLLESARLSKFAAQKGADRPSFVNDSFFQAAGIDSAHIHEGRNNVFVLTPFHPRYESTYETIKSVCSRLNLDCRRGDEEFRPGAVLSHVLELIARASIIIVNIDGRNPNVYYELGIAHAIGKRTVLVTSDIESVPFDIQSQRIIIHKSPDDLAHQLTLFLARSLVDES